MDIKLAIDQFKKGDGKNKGRLPDERYASFDFCYNHFYSFYRQNKISDMASEKNLQASCLHLGFYLASWGMLRGSSFLLEKSIRHYSNLIKLISKLPPKVWKIDVDNYNEDNIHILLGVAKKIKESLSSKEKYPSDTLITKIMLGVFGNAPALDQYVKKSFKVYALNKKTLNKIKIFYDNNKDIIDGYEINTLDFFTGQDTDIKYTKAKLIDMYGFIAGQ